MDHLNRFVPPQALDPFSNRTRLHCSTFLTECNSTAVTPHYLTTGSATIPMPPYVNTGNTPALRHTTSIPVPAPHSAIPSSICPLPFYFARPWALPRKGTLLKTKLRIKSIPLLPNFQLTAQSADGKNLHMQPGKNQNIRKTGLAPPGATWDQASH